MKIQVIRCADDITETINLDGPGWDSYGYFDDLDEAAKVAEWRRKELDASIKK